MSKCFESLLYFVVVIQGIQALLTVGFTKKGEERKELPGILISSEAKVWKDLSDPMLTGGQPKSRQIFLLIWLFRHFTKHVLWRYWSGSDRSARWFIRRIVINPVLGWIDAHLLLLFSLLMSLSMLLSMSLLLFYYRYYYYSYCLILSSVFKWLKH